MIGSLRARLGRSSLAQNAVALYGAHAVGLVLPLVAIPYLARVLRPEWWGLVVFAQSFSASLTLILEYGFYLSGTRRLARVREDRDQVATIVAEVQSAKLLLLVGITAATLVAYVTVPVFAANPVYLFWAWLLAVGQGMSPLWYFLGVERVRRVAAAEAAGKLVATVGIFVLVRAPEHGWVVLALQAVTTIVWAVLTTRWIYADVPWRVAGIRRAWWTLRDAAGIFVFRTSLGVYVMANSFILGLLAGTQIVAFFGGAERIIRGAINLMHPATQVVYPRVSHLITHDRREAGRILSLSLILVGALGALMCVTTIAAAPLLVRVLLGPGYEAAVPVLRALALLPPIIAVETVVGIQWALPTGQERYYYSAAVVGAIVNVAAAVMLVPRYGALGMAGAVLAAECVVVSALVGLAATRGRDLWGTGLRQVLPFRAGAAKDSITPVVDG